MGTIQAIFLMSLLGLASGAGLLPDSINAVMGGNVYFNSSLNPTQTPFISLTWQIGTKDIITSNIVNITNPEYEGRITLFISTGSLELRNVTRSDNGVYRVTIIQAGVPQETGTTTLQVDDKVSQLSVTVSSSDLVEYSSVTLYCSASGSSLSFLWFNGSNEVTASDRVSLTDGGATLTIVTVNRYDWRAFQCQVSNPVSSSTSYPMNLVYGSENLNITGERELYVGQSLVIVCSAESEPVIYTWMFKGKKISDGSVLQKDNIDKSNEGTYICEASNSVTGKSLRGEHSLSIKANPLSGGAIAGIVIGLMIVEGIVFGIVIYFICENLKKETN